MPTYTFSYSGGVDIEAATQGEAEEKFFAMTDAEVGATIEEYEGMEELHDARTCENSVPCLACEAQEKINNSRFSYSGALHKAIKRNINGS